MDYDERLVLRLALSVLGTLIDQLDKHASACRPTTRNFRDQMRGCRRRLRECYTEAAKSGYLAISVLRKNGSSEQFVRQMCDIPLHHNFTGGGRIIFQESNGSVFMEMEPGVDDTTHRVQIEIGEEWHDLRELFKGFGDVSVAAFIHEADATKWLNARSRG